VGLKWGQAGTISQTCAYLGLVKSLGVIFYVIITIENYY
jgi:hypothetical protein